MCGPKYASRQKTNQTEGVDFYITAQAVELLQEKPHLYDELASGRLVGGLNTYAYVGGNPISYVDPEGLFLVYAGDGVTVISNSGNPAGGTEHARHGPGQAYHVHIKDGATGRDVRISTETWKPLTPADQKLYDNSKAVKNFCESLTDGQKKFLDKLNRQVFHTGVPKESQLRNLLIFRGSMRVGSRGGD